MLVVGRLHDAVAEGQLPVGKVLLGLGAVALATSPTGRMLKQAARTRQGQAFVLFGVAIVLSLPFSLLRSGTLELVVDYLIRMLPLTAVVVISMRTLADIERVFRAMVVMVLLSGLLIVAGFGETTYGPDGGRTALSGAYDPNDLALVMATGGAACLWLLRERSVFWRVVAIAALVLGMYVTYRTGSRGGALSFAAMLGLALFLQRRTLPTWFRFSLIPAAAVALAFAPAQYMKRLSTLVNFEQDYNLRVEDGRKQIWLRGMGYFVSRPLTGVGAGQFGTAEGRYGAARGRTAAWKWSAAHNMYVEAAAEMGVFGIVSVLGMLIPSVSMWRRIRVRRARSELEQRYQSAVETLAVSVLTFMVGATFLSATFSSMLLLLCALGIGLSMVPESRLFDAGATRAQSSTNSRHEWSTSSTRGGRVRRPRATAVGLAGSQP